LPRREEIARAQLVFLAAVGGEVGSRLRQIADRAGVLLNVEDDLARSDFHSPAVVRRGDLTIAISTGGKNPGLAAALRQQVEACFGLDWGERLDRAAALRARWRHIGCDATTISHLTSSWLDREAGCTAGGLMSR
jgi:precorrin-2 dehydrogenase/sirohydrochlorin ferrochelatase